MAEVLEHESFTYEGGWVFEDGDRLFNIGVIRDAQELRAVICAWRCGLGTGEKMGRRLQQFEIGKALGLQAHVFANSHADGDT